MIAKCHVLIFTWFLVMVCCAQAHPADESGLRVRPSPHRLEIRLTFNIFTLTRFVRVDADGDGRIGISELDAARPALVTYLEQHVSLQINGTKTALGQGAVFEYLWPDARATPPMTEPEYAARNVDVTYLLPVEGRLLANFWIDFDIFEQTGPLQTIHASYEQEGMVTDVQFSAQTSEYRYETGFERNPFVQEAEKKQGEKKRPKETTQTPSSSNDERWWMVRLAVLIFIMVMGRRAALVKRACKIPTRRQRRS